jgi:hypothetical protein
MRHDSLKNSNMNDDVGVARIRIQGDWELEMVGALSHVYVQVYSAACFLLAPIDLFAESPVSTVPQGTVVPSIPHLLTDEQETGRYSYPWRGGFSAVNFFRSVHAQLPVRYRPDILEIAYASPGFIELAGYCAALSLVVSTVTKNANRILVVYKNIQDEIRKNKLNKLEERQRNAQVSFMEHAYAQLTQAMELPEVADKRLHDVTKNDRWARLKIALALARRIDRLAHFERLDLAALEEPQTSDAVLLGNPSADKARKLTAKTEASLSKRHQDPLALPPRVGMPDDEVDDE